MKKTLKQTLSMIVVLTLLLGILPVNAWAVDHVHDESCGYAEPSKCTHAHDGACGYVAEVLGVACGHSHDAACGYSEGSAGTPCGHVHGSCGYAEAIPGTSCTHDCASGGCTQNEDGSYTCTHTHGDCGYSEGTPASACTHTEHTDCGYVPEVHGTACNHSHDSICGYVEAVSGNPCTHTHDTVCGYSEGSECTYVETPVDETEHTHIWADGWTSNTTDHWHECTADGCDLPAGEAHPDKGSYSEHSYDSNYTCTACNYTCPHTGAETNYDMDSTHHWGVCGNGTCGYTTAKETHDQNGENGSCSVCYYDPDNSTDPDVHTHEWGGWESNGDGTHTRTCRTNETHTETETCAEYAIAMVDEHNHNILCECMYVLGMEAHTMSEWFRDDKFDRRQCTKNCDYFEEREHTHTWGDYISNGNGSHTRRCTANGCTSQQSESCDGTATCHEFAICSYCGAPHGGYDKLNHSGGTEVRNAKDATETEAGYTGDTYCLGCGIKISEGSIIPATGSGDDDDDTHTHNYYYYKYDGTNHWKMCGCGQGQAGSVKAHTLLIHGNNNGHWKECTICDYFSDLQAHVYSNDSDASCNECEYERHVHNYSTAATCISPAKCSCGATTGSKDPYNHTGGAAIRDVVEATYKTEGYTGDTYCKGCGEKLASGKYTMRKGFVDVKYDDDAVVKEVTFQTVEGVTLPNDAEVIVKDYTATLAPIDSLLGRDVNTEYLDINDVDITIIENDTYTHPDGTEYRIGEIILINGEEYVISNWVGTGDHLSLTRLSDGASSLYNAVSNVLDFKGSLITTPGEYPFERVNIGGVTYDVVLYFEDIEGSGRTTYLYYKGIPVGKMRSGGYYFCKGYDPATLAAQQNKSFLATVTIPKKDPRSKTREELVADLEAAQQAYDEYVRVNFTMSAELAMAKRMAEQALAEYDAMTKLTLDKTYNVSVVGSNDISVPGYDEALLNSIKVETEAEKAAKEGVERLKADMEAKWAALDQLDTNDPNHMEAWAAWYEAETAYKASLAALLNHKKATVTQTFDIPAEFIGNENVKYVAVHDTNPYAEALAEAREKLDENFTMEGAREYLDIKALYDEWEATHGNGAQFGGLSISKDGKTLTATYAVDGFSPFIVYAFVEADEPEIKTLSATVVDGDDTTSPTEPVVNADPIPKEGGYAWLWIVVAILAAGAAVTIVVISKKKKK